MKTVATSPDEKDKIDLDLDLDLAKFYLITYR